MKVQCDCGTKYSFDVTPEMASRPVQFVCQVCGLDSSVRVNELIRQELAAAMAVPAPAAVPPAPSPPTARARVVVAQRAVGGGGAATVAAEPESAPLCLKHPGQVAAYRCYVCQKPICPQCMELFGYVCSPLCKARAESHGIEVPVYAGQKSVVEARLWRKVGLISGSVAALIVAVLGLWFWYAWFGSRPKPVFAVRFEQPAYSGQCLLAGKDQIVFLHGGTLSRYDLKLKKEIWSRDLIDKKRIADAVAVQMKAIRAAVDSSSELDLDRPLRMPSPEELTQQMEKAAAAALQLHVRDQNVWIASPGKLARYDWDTGKPAQEVASEAGFGDVLDRGDELLTVSEKGNGQHIVTHVSLVTGQSKTEEIGEPVRSVASLGSARKPKPAAAGVKTNDAAGLPVGMAGDNAGKPLDPSKVAEQAQNMTLPAKIALPAVLANAMRNEQINAELRDTPDRRPPRAPTASFEFARDALFIPSRHGYIEFSVRLIESRYVARQAMKDPPAKSSIDGNLTVTKTAEVANEILNDLQRMRGGDTVTEDQSRYYVTVCRAGQKDVPDWSAEVVGPPRMIPQATVDVIAAGKTVVVLDKSNRKRWGATLTYNVSNFSGLEGDESTSGSGPCVERGDMLYVVDEAVLTAFDLATGNARWRLPLVGVSGLFFDGKGFLYVNATTAGPESIKYSRQIDVTKKTSVMIVKVDPKQGKILWRSAAVGRISYLSGKFIYTVSSFQTDEELAENSMTAILTQPSYLKIRRINPASGKVMWEHYQQRAPLDVRFEKNSIQLVFKKEVQVLRYLSL